MTDQVTIDHIIELKQRIARDNAPYSHKRRYDDYAEDVEINTPFNSAYTDSMSNRGNKLFNDESLKLTDLKSHPSNLKVEFANDEDRSLIVNSDYYSNKRHKHYRLYDNNGNRLDVDDAGKGDGTSNGHTEQSDEDDEDEEENPLGSINLTEILAPIQHPADVINRKSIAATFNPDKKGNHLLRLAYDTIEMIESEQDTVIQLTKLMNMFLGDEYHELTPENINLPDYDHKLSLKSLNQSMTTNPNELFHGNSEDEDDTKEEDENRKILTRSKDNANITDPFFQLPNFQANKSIDTIDPQEAEATRQLTQITLQRNQEFIRCLTKIRNGCVKVDKFKQNIYKWSKEMSGDYSGSDNIGASKESSVENGE